MLTLGTQKVLKMTWLVFWLRMLFQHAGSYEKSYKNNSLTIVLSADSNQLALEDQSTTLFQAFFHTKGW